VAKIKLLTEARKNSMNKLYSTCAESVIAISSVYKCNRCTKWHSSGAATGWVLTADGIMVTNYHVFDGKKVAGFGIRTRDGKVAPVVEILAASKRDDVAIFRVEGSGFKPLPLGPSAEVGSDLHIIAHPDSRFYTYTSGKVSRYYKKRTPGNKGPGIMAVTAEFARGSSGGPVMDSSGNVVGMVASTQSIYYPPKKKTDKQGPFQMVIRNCVPVSAIKALIETPKN
ncbi:MAG: S1 family peptidase, partial [Akkermansiaceae bacterium]